MRECGMEVPALENMPSLLPHERYVLDLYVAISQSRPQSLTDKVAPIPLSEIAAAYDYLQLHEQITRLDWLRTVQMLDSALREHLDSTKGKT